MISTLVMAVAMCAGADDVAAKTIPNGVTSTFLPSGITKKIGGFRPSEAELDGKAESVKKAPEGLAAPKYGTLKLGNKEYLFILDEPKDKPAKLYVDTNNDGDLTNDPEPKLVKEKTRGTPKKFTGSAQVDLGEGKLATINVYRFDPVEEQRAGFKSRLMYYADYGYELTFELDGKKFTTNTGSDPQMAVWIDRDGNKKRSVRLEVIRIGKPFNFTGTTYVLSREGEAFKLAKADKPIPVAPLPPDLRVGKKVIPFEIEGLDGSKISFPKDYAGKLVLIDFWATWHEPCIQELPNVKRAYKDWHEKGFDVIGVSLDHENQKEKVEAFLKKQEIPWKQNYEGKTWDTTLGVKYDVSGIPFVLLVDGDTGKILARDEQVRGKGLSEFIGKQLEKKKKNAPR